MSLTKEDLETALTVSKDELLSEMRGMKDELRSEMRGIEDKVDTVLETVRQIENQFADRVPPLCEEPTDKAPFARNGWG